MDNILIVGAGKIGALMATILLEDGNFQVSLADKVFDGSDVKRIHRQYEQLKMYELDVTDKNAFADVLKKGSYQAVISCLPFFLNIHVAEMAKEFNVHYFDLTEDVKTTHAIKEIAKSAQSAFVPQCGLAPGMIGIIAHDYMGHFDEVEMVKMRVGALPYHANNALHYALTWSTHGLINEYGNPCIAIENGKIIKNQPLEGLELIEIDGLHYEAFNTSGGLGSLAEAYENKVKRMNYKTIRYPGHCKKMRFLMRDLKLNEDRDTLKRILERAIPKTYQDVVLIYVSVIGHREGEYLEETFVKKIYPQTIAGHKWSAIQVTTAAGLCNVLSLVLAENNKYKGFVYQENMSLRDAMNTPFGKYYA